MEQYKHELTNIIGRVFTSVTGSEGENEFRMVEDKTEHEFVFRHFQDCCEDVHIAEVHGDLDDLENTPILDATCETEEGYYEWGDLMWTFYTIRTIKGTVTIRWRGESNGHYSIEVANGWQLKGDKQFDWSFSKIDGVRN